MEDLAPPTFNIPNVQNIALKNIHAGMSQSDDTTEESRYTRFLEHHLPASVVIGEDDTVLHFFGDYNQYLTLAPGRASLNFFSMLCKDLSLVAATAISRCRTEHTAVTYTDIAVDTPSGRKVIDLTVEPIPGQEGENELAAVLFLDRSADRPGGVVEKYDLDATAARRISDLEREFQVSQRDLRSTIQRLETVNGELQAANEELLTANEELQSSTEELQSVNEELYTVNTEHQLKLDELTTMTNDLSNFLSSTMIGILFVDGDLNIRKFTEYVGREFQLMEHDVGRNIQIFAHSFPEEAIEADCRTVLRDLVSIDREVTAMNGRCYTLRIAPYRTTENSIRGLVHHHHRLPGARSGSPGPPRRRRPLPPRSKGPRRHGALKKTARQVPAPVPAFCIRQQIRPLPGPPPPCCRSPPDPVRAPSPHTAGGPPPDTAPPAGGAP